ncbi:MAG: hypothetical protein CMA88_00975 [Euryarchaeota archaeon]|nr:hypothetical protein [Euryarchaeota archaeon]
MELGKKEQEVSETLHIPALRRKWQILVLQITSTASLLLLLKRMSEIYGQCSDQFIIDHSENSWCPSYEHTRGLMWLRNQDELLIPDVMLGVNQTGTMSLLGPLLMCVVGVVAIDRFWASSNEIQTRIKQGVAAVFGAWIIIPFIFSWLVSTISNGFHFPWNSNDSMNHMGELFSPMGLVLELVFLGVVFAPIIAGLVGIWGLSKRAITWAVGYYIVVIAFHSILTFEPIVSEVDVGLRALPTQIGEGTLFWGLVSPLARSLLEVSILMLLFLESGTAAIGHMEYAVSLPEESKRDPEFVRQFNNVVNSHLIQLGVVVTLVAITTAMALAFDDLMISIVGILEGTQWTGQVKESLELQMTYGKVISAGLFIMAVAGLRFVVPWQTVSGYIESGISRMRS